MMTGSERLQANQEVADSLVGLTKAQALERLASSGLVVRLMDYDRAGDFMMTDDLRVGRVTVHVQGSVVTQAEAG